MLKTRWQNGISVASPDRFVVNVNQMKKRYSILYAFRAFLIAGALVLCMSVSLPASAQSIRPLVALSAHSVNDIHNNRTSLLSPTDKSAVSVPLLQSKEHGVQGLPLGCEQAGTYQHTASVYPIGATIESVGEPGVRRAPTGPPIIDGSDPDPENPGVDLPLSDGGLFLLLLTVLYGVVLTDRRRWSADLSKGKP